MKLLNSPAKDKVLDFKFALITRSFLMILFGHSIAPSKPVTGYQRLPKNQNFSGNQPFTMVTT